MTDKNINTPWTVMSHVRDSIVSGGKLVAIVISNEETPEEREARAHLISASPQLLAECKNTQSELNNMIRNKECDFSKLGQWFSRVTIAINKAEGK